MEKKVRMSMLFLITVLCTVLFCLASHAQLETGCPAGTHEYVSQVLVPASESKRGEVQNTCIYCGDAYIEYLPATGHVFGPWEAAEENGGRLERRTCSQCGRSEERMRSGIPAVSDIPPKTSAGRGNAWRVNSMDYMLTAATGGVWGYAAIVLWWNGLVLIWYKKECLRRKKEKNDDVE